MTTVYPEIIVVSSQEEYTSLAINALKKQDSRKCKRRLATQKSRSKHHSIKSSSSSSSSSSARESTVLVSPRLLPFPYHNDSLFLPTVEHPQGEWGRSITTRRSCSSLANNTTFRSGLSSAFVTSLPPPPPPRRQTSAPPVLSKRRKATEASLSRPEQPSRSPSWLCKIWKSMKKPSWQLRLSSSTKTMVSIIS